MKKITLILLFVAICNMVSWATVKIDALYYELDEKNQTAMVTYQSKSANKNYVTGSLVIPTKVEYDGTTYTVTSIDEWAFRDNPNLYNVQIPETITSIGVNAFAFTGLMKIKLPISLSSIEPETFRSCVNLINIELPKTITSIGNDAFNDCKALEEIIIPNSVISIGDRAFYICKNLSKVTIGNSTISLGLGAFDGCALLHVKIGDSVKEIGNNTFGGSANLQSVVIGRSVISIGTNNFESINLREVYNYANIPQAIPSNYFSLQTTSVGVLYVPTESVELYKNAQGWKEFFIILPINQDENVASKNVTNNVTYLDNDGYEINNHAVALSLPVPEQKEGYQFLKWTVLQGDLDEGIRVQAQYAGEGAEKNLFYLDKDGEEMHSHSVTLSLPEPEEIPGYTFQKWVVVGGDLDDGIHVQAQYVDDGVLNDVPSIEENDVPAMRKTIRNGQVYILKGTKVYDVSGKELK